MTKKELKLYIKEDKAFYFRKSILKRMYHFLTKSNRHEIGKYIILARKAGFYRKESKTIIGKAIFVYYMRRKNCLGRKLGIELNCPTFGRRIQIWHGPVVVNYYTVIGDDCVFRGNNCIGNNKDEGAPVIGNHVHIGVGANIIGNVTIGNNIQIGANSLVNKSFKEENITIVGIPAKKIGE